MVSIVLEEEGGRVVGGVVGVGKGDRVIGDVVFAILKAADHRLGLAKAKAIAGAGDRDAGRQGDQLVEVRGGIGIVDEIAADRRLRLGGGQRGGDRRGLRRVRTQHDDVGGGQRLLVIGLPCLIGAGRLRIGGAIGGRRCRRIGRFGGGKGRGGDQNGGQSAATLQKRRKRNHDESPLKEGITAWRVRRGRRRSCRPDADRRAGRCRPSCR